MPQKITTQSDPFKKRQGFGSIRSGDITRWSKGTSHFAYPEPKNKKKVFTPITSLRALKRKETAKAAVQGQVVIVGQMTKDKSVREEIESCERSAARVDRSIEISNEINKRFGLL